MQQNKNPTQPELMVRVTVREGKQRVHYFPMSRSDYSEVEKSFLEAKGQPLPIVFQTSLGRSIFPADFIVSISSRIYNKTK